MNGNRQESIGQPEFAEEGLSGRDLVQLVAAVHLSQHHGRRQEASETGAGGRRRKVGETDPRRVAWPPPWCSPSSSSPSSSSCSSPPFCRTRGWLVMRRSERRFR